MPIKQLCMVAYTHTLKEILINWRRPANCLNALLFFVMVIILFPLSITPEKNLLRLIAPGIIWVAALLASLLSLDNLFQHDYEDGALEQLLLNPAPLSLLIFAKLTAQWLLNAVPLLLVTPLLGLMLQLTTQEIMLLLLSLLLGTPILISIGAIAAAMTVGLAGRGVLLAILVLPLVIPILILGAGSVTAYMQHIPVTSNFLLLLALLILATLFTPPTIAAALRLSQW